MLIIFRLVISTIILFIFSINIYGIDLTDSLGTERKSNKILVSQKVKKEKKHIVLAGENLFTIAKRYQLKTWQLRVWNGLTGDALKINQILVLEKPKNFVAKTTKKDTLKPKFPIVITKKKTALPGIKGSRKVSEQGIGELIDAGIRTDKFLGLHHTAPIGTLIKITNQANGQSVWVKIIGKLNSTDNVVIKISPRAFEKLLPKDTRIRANLNYRLGN